MAEAVQHIFPVCKPTLHKILYSYYRFISWSNICLKSWKVPSGQTYIELQ